MSNINFLEEAQRENTKKTYHSSIRHFELTWGGRLPTTPSGILDYLNNYAGQLSHSTLSVRMTALSDWHKKFGFADPTQGYEVKQTLKGIRRVHGRKPKQATPASLEEISSLHDHLNSNDDLTPTEALRRVRDWAIISLLFWKALRPDELTKINLENLEVSKENLSFYLYETKNFNAMQGRNFYVPRIEQYCPVKAIEDWIEFSRISGGPLFRKIDRYGNISDAPMKPGSLRKILNRRFNEIGLTERSAYTFRRGFATWAAQNGWTVQALKEYVGWKNSKTPERYIEANNNAFGFAINKGIESHDRLRGAPNHQRLDQYPKSR